jgi:hypothetical protein
MPFYFLKTTALKDFHEPIRFERQILLPQVTSRKEKVFDITEQNIMAISELKTVNPKQFSELIGKIKGNTLCPVRAKSNSADLYIILEKNGRRVEQAYQFKATDDIGFYNLSEELEKARFSENEGLHLFIVMALGYSKEITAHMNDSIDFMVLKSGIYFKIENGLLFHVSNNLKPLSFIKNGKELPIREATENQDLLKQKNLFEIYGKYYVVEDIEIAGKARHAIRDGSLFCEKTLKLNISDQVECLLIGPKLLKEFIGESNWDDLLKIRNGTQKDKLLILESQVSKRFRKGDLERDSPSKKFKQEAPNISQATQSALGMPTAGGSGQQMITTSNQEPFDLAVWIANKLGLNVEREDHKSRLDELIEAFDKAGFRTLRSVSRIDERGIAAINSELKMIGKNELKVGEELSLLSS